MAKRDAFIVVHSRRQMVKEQEKDSQPFLLIMLMIWIIITIFWNYFT